MKSFLINLVLISILLFQNENVNLFIQIILWITYSFTLIVFFMPDLVYEQWDKQDKEIKPDYFSLFMSLIFVGVFIYLGYVFLAVMQLFCALALVKLKKEYKPKPKKYKNIQEIIDKS